MNRDFIFSISLFTFLFVSCVLVSGKNFPVNTFSELKNALKKANGDVIVIQRDINITQSLSQITKKMTITSSVTKCLSKSSQKRRCRLVAFKSYGHFKVGKGGRLVIQRVEFRSGIGGSGTGSDGGSLLVTDGGSLHVQNCAFRFNKATNLLRGGGAISVQSKSSLKVQASLFVRNSAGLGGAIDVNSKSTASISTSVFNRNTGRLVGGAISITLDSTAVIYKNKFARNFATFGGTSYVKGSSVSFCSNTYNETNKAELKGNRNYIDSSTINICKESKNSFTLTKKSSSKNTCSPCKA